MADFEDLILPPDTRANQPAAGIAGRVYFVTDENVTERDNGSAWEDYSPPAGLTNPMTTQGDVIYGGASGTPTRLAKGTATQVLTMNAGATDPEWATASSIVYSKSATMWHDQSLVTAGNALTFSIDGNQKYGFYNYQNPSANGNTTTNGFVIAAGTYVLSIYSYVNTNLGKVDFYIDNVQVGTTQDFYSGGLAYNTTKTITGIVITAGYHTFKTVVNGKNASASTYNFPVTKFTLTPEAY